MKKFISTISILTVGFLSACSEQKFPVTFHLEAPPSDSGKFTFYHHGVCYSKAPFFSHNQIDSYYSFPAGDNTYGIVVIAKKGYAPRIEAMTEENKGKKILPVVNGHTMQPMQIYDRPITGGKLAILGGFSPADLKEMSEFISPKDEKREAPILKMAPYTRPLLEKEDPNDKKAEQKESTSKSPDAKVIRKRRGRI